MSDFEDTKLSDNTEEPSGESKTITFTEPTLSSQDILARYVELPDEDKESALKDGEGEHWCLHSIVTKLINLIPNFTERDFPLIHHDHMREYITKKLIEAQGPLVGMWPFIHIDTNAAIRDYESRCATVEVNGQVYWYEADELC